MVLYKKCYNRNQIALNSQLTQVVYTGDIKMTKVA